MKHTRSCVAAVLLVPLLALAAACDEGATSCVRDSQCPAGQRCADGLCSPTIFDDAGEDSRPAQDLTADRGPTFDGADSRPSADLEALDGGRCVANADDRVERSELPVVVGAQIAYTIGGELTVNLQGTTEAGRRHWELTANAADDAREVLTLEPLFSWAEESFPDATYATLIDRGYQTYGVFRLTNDALKLLGVISRDEPTFGSGTELVYGDALDMLRFPIEAGQSFETSASASGTFDGLYLYVSERYEVSVLGAGVLTLPDITFDHALLVQVRITQTPYANPWLVSHRAVFMFVVECYGIVARIVVDGDPKDLAAVTAKERWRLSF